MIEQTREHAIALVREAYAAFGSRDTARLQALGNAATTWHAPGAGILPWAGRHTGPHGAAHFVAALDKHLEFLSFEVTELIADVAGPEARIIALGRAECRVRSTGETYVNEWAHLFRIANGKITAFREYPDTGAQLVALRSN